AGARLLDARRRDAQVEIVAERFANQRLERRIVEDLPPRRVGERLRLGAVDEPILRRHRNLRPVVVRTDCRARADRQRQDRRSKGETRRRTHAPHVSGFRAARAPADGPPPAAGAWRPREAAPRRRTTSESAGRREWWR